MLSQNNPDSTNASPFTTLFDRIAIMSFEDYKIDYQNCLGQGACGAVYGVVPRPACEKNFFSKWFPYTFDYFFPVKDVDRSTPYCVKIFHFGISSDQKNTEAATQKLLIQRGVSRLTFFATDSNQAQFKTLIRGKTLGWHLKNTTLFINNNFPLRKALYDFIVEIHHSQLCIYDLHTGNIMYDEINNRWETIDSFATDQVSYRKCLDALDVWDNYGTKPFHELTKTFIYMVQNNIAFNDSIDDAVVAKRINTCFDPWKKASDARLAQNKKYDIDQSKLFKALDVYKDKSICTKLFPLYTEDYYSLKDDTKIYTSGEHVSFDFFELNNLIQHLIATNNLPALHCILGHEQVDIVLQLKDTSYLSSYYVTNLFNLDAKTAGAITHFLIQYSSFYALFHSSYDNAFHLLSSSPELIKDLAAIGDTITQQTIPLFEHKAALKSCDKITTALAVLDSRDIIKLAAQKPEKAVLFCCIVHWLKANNMDSLENLNSAAEHLEQINYLELIFPKSIEDLDAELLWKKVTTRRVSDTHKNTKEAENLQLGLRRR